jgi:hypothetical protein
MGKGQRTGQDRRGKDAGLAGRLQRAEGTLAHEVDRAQRSLRKLGCPLNQVGRLQQHS